MLCQCVFTFWQLLWFAAVESVLSVAMREQLFGVCFVQVLRHALCLLSIAIIDKRFPWPVCCGHTWNHYNWLHAYPLNIKFRDDETCLIPQMHNLFTIDNCCRTFPFVTLLLILQFEAYTLFMTTILYFIKMQTNLVLYRYGISFC